MLLYLAASPKKKLFRAPPNLTKLGSIESGKAKKECFILGSDTLGRRAVFSDVVGDLFALLVSLRRHCIGFQSDIRLR